MNDLRVWIIIGWIALPTVMYGGYSLLHLINKGGVLAPYQAGWFRAGHAHAGVLLLMSLLFYIFLNKTAYSLTVKNLTCAVLAVGVLAQSGGFFIHMIPSKAALGTKVTVTGAALLVCAIAMLVYGLITAV